MNKYEKIALSKLPVRLADAVSQLAGLNGGVIHEIRLRKNKPVVITVNDKNYASGVICSKDDIDFTVKKLCSDSLYAHFHTIRDGYIDAGNGIRAGICGQAVMADGKITSVKEISSVSIRIPRRVPGAASEILSLITANDYSSNVLIYSKPGVGKTTILRELAAELSSGTSPKRVAVVDTRGELAAGIEDASMLDVLSGYPRAQGIEIAVRSLSPQYIICDEIISTEDASAVITAFGSGVKICASVHADSYEGLSRQPTMRELLDQGAFDVVAGLIQTGKGDKRYHIEVREG